MAGRRTNWPHSPQQDRHEIVRQQKSFGAGVWNDELPKSTPPNGLYYLRNGITFSNKVRGRPGNKLFSAQVPTLLTGISASKALSGDALNSIITVTGDYVWSSADVGRYFMWPDGKNDPILSVTHVGPGAGDFELTVPVNGDHDFTSLAKLRDDVNLLEWQPIVRKWVLLIGPNLYVADWDMTAWTQVCPVDSDTLSAVKSRMSIMERRAVIWNSAGVFVVVFDKATPEYWKLNSPIPTLRAIDTGASTYCRRIIQTFVALSGDGVRRERGVDGVFVEHESGSNKVDENQIDYASIWSANAVSSSNPISYLLYPTSAARHFRHYGIYGTLDTGVNGTDVETGQGTQVEQYYWIADVPMIKVATVSRVADDANITTSRVDALSSYAPFAGYDVGATIKYYDPAINNFRTEAIATYANEETITATLTTDLTDMPAIIGGTSVCIATKSGTTVSRQLVGSSFTSDDVGKTLFWEDGSYDVIRSVTNSNTVVVWKSGTKYAQAAGWNPTSRLYRDTTPDDEDGNMDSLINRDLHLLNTRFLYPLPNCNVGTSVPGFIIGAQSGGHEIYYSQTGSREFTGYYHAGWQIHHCDDAVIDLSAFEAVAVAYCRQGWGYFDLAATQGLAQSDTSEIRGKPLGMMPIAILTTFRYKNEDGILCRGAYQKTRMGYDFFITDKRQMKQHFGLSTGENLVAGRIMKKLEKTQPVTSLHYDDRSGLVAWFTEDEAV
jgi:hypothetical protein